MRRRITALTSTTAQKFRMVGKKKPVLEVSTKYQPVLGLASRLLNKRLPKMEMTTSATGIARATPGERNAYVICNVESLNFVNNDDVTSLTGISPPI